MAFPNILSQTKGSGHPAVFLHAFPLSAGIWKDLQPPADVQLILPDFPGFGSSPLAPQGLTLEQATLGLREKLQQLGINNLFTLAGISMGGYWALEFVRQFPEQVEKLILISTRAGVDNPQGRQKRLDMAERVQKEGTGFMIEAMVPGLLGKTTLEQKPEIVKMVGNWIQSTAPQAVALAQTAMANRRDQTDLLSKIKAQTLILAGTEDSLIPPSESESMAKAIPGSRLLILERVGHLLPLENPSQFQEIMNEFLSIPG